MADLTFNAEDKTFFPTKHHGDVWLLKQKWEKICKEPERLHFKHNTEKIATTLINPDYVRRSKTYKNQLIYYKEFDKIKLNDRVEILAKKQYRFWAVVIDEVTQRLWTLYPTEKPKPGFEFKPKV